LVRARRWLGSGVEVDTRGKGDVARIMIEVATEPPTDRRPEEGDDHDAGGVELVGAAVISSHNPARSHQFSATFRRTVERFVAGVMIGTMDG
jgi:hypothetical protein